MQKKNQRERKKNDIYENWNLIKSFHIFFMLLILIFIISFASFCSCWWSRRWWWWWWCLCSFHIIKVRRKTFWKKKERI